MKRLLVLALLSPAGLTGAAAAQPQPAIELFPGVTYERHVEYTLHGRVVTHVVTAPKPEGLYSLAPVPAGGTVRARLRLTAIERRLASKAEVVGIGASAFPVRSGPSGLVERDGVLQGLPDPDRASFGLSGAELRVQRLDPSADWRGTGPPRELRALNAAPHAGWVTLYTRAWGASTPRAKSTLEAIIPSLPPATPNSELTGLVTRLVSGGRHAIPEGGAVLSARGGSRARLRAEARQGTTVTIRLGLPESWNDVTDGLGGGPELVRGGRALFDPGESFDPLYLSTRLPRGAIGQRADGSLLLVSVDGSRPGYSVGMTNWELARELQSLGAETAVALAGGKPAAAAFDGVLLSRPAGGEQPVSNALLLEYTGVQAFPPSEAVLSPNGDGVAERQRLGFRLFHPAHVTATLTGPGGAGRTFLEDRLVRPGRYAWSWDGAGRPEGGWTWTVTAAEDVGGSEATRAFLLDTTLKGLTVAPAVLHRGALHVSLTLLHPARLIVRIESRGGTLIRTLRTTAAPAGQVALTWSGRVRGRTRLPAGRYQVRAVATNSIGEMSLVAPFRARP